MVEVASAFELSSAVQTAQPGTAIVLAPGTYVLDTPLWLGNPSMTLFGDGGGCSAVVLEASALTEAVIVAADDISLVNLTVRGSQDVNIHVHPGTSGLTVYNCAVLDASNQLVKVSSYFDGRTTDDGLLACSRFEFTGYAPAEGHVNGISMHAIAGWVVRDNLIRGVRGPGGSNEVGPALLIWSESRDVVVERNAFVDCARSIALGNPWHEGGLEVHVHHGVVRNNFVAADGAGTLLELHSARGYEVSYNTFMTTGADAIVQVGDNNDGRLAYNLSSGELLGGWGTGYQVEGNVTGGAAGWFADAAAGDLHLQESVGDGVIGGGAPIAGIEVDIDGDSRGASPDVGADQRGGSTRFPPGSCAR